MLCLQVTCLEKSFAVKTSHLEPEEQFDSAAVVEAADPSGLIGPSPEILVLENSLSEDGFRHLENRK